MILTDARTRLAKLLDDAEADRWDSTEIDDALKSAQLEAWSVAVASGANVYNVEGSFTASSAGAVDLTSVKPRRIVSVAHYLSGQRFRVRPVRQEASPRDYALAAPLRILSVPQVSFPASGAADFVWGHADIDAHVLDELMLLMAYSALKPKEGEKDHYQARRETLEQRLLDAPSVPGWSVQPLDGLSGGRGYIAPFGYMVSAPHTLQLVTV